MQFYISIIIPCYNESHRLPKSFIAIRDFIRKQQKYTEIIFVDDGSKDNTYNLLKKFVGQSQSDRVKIRVIKLPKNTGKGAAVRKGVLAASGGIIIFTDADLSTPFTEVAKAIKYINRGYDFILGSRETLGSEKSGEPKLRTLIGFCYRLLLDLIGIKGDIKDTQCGFKGFSKKAAQQIFKRQFLNGGSFDLEIIFIARYLKLKYKEIPVSWKHVPGSTINILHDIINHPVDIIRIYYYYFRGCYN